MRREAKEFKPMHPEHKVGVVVTVCVLLGTISLFVATDRSSTRGGENNRAEHQAKMDLCAGTDDPTACLVVFERIEACDNLEDGEDNCLANVQETLAGE